MPIISTIPRSGTNLIYYFFKYLELFSSNLELIKKEDDEVFSNFKTKTDFKWVGKSLIIGHGYCPGYELNISNPWYAQWSQLPNSDNWFNAISAYNLRDNPHYDFAKNKNLKVVFVYRNPYDCLLSLYDHLQGHKNYDLTNKSFDSFVVEVLPHYVKSYISFKEMKLEYEDNILLIKYENLIQDRKNYLKEICKFISFDVHENFIFAFDKAYEYTDIHKMKLLEKFIGQTLAGDQKEYNQSKSHIRKIDRSSERSLISDESQNFIKNMLTKFDMLEVINHKLL